ncbi:DUF7196 family protein [Wenjunlia tyrosinilytica]|uniref:DUF7196 domain-containing protein n=1 Tax=Wenjunlia tyrosinilytica TaxID=1544741 RepID=A0A918DXV1_9ACTN|nr:hypothetical protein [Wenjunlia tyrosinilytica]GGO90042.1 hypothetical protein GCM10012280_34650 [Wenjunlia tyrosinilytica]
MGCNCGGGARRTVTVYQLTMPNGSARQYHTRQEADAANARAGGTGTVTVVTSPSG